MQVRKPARFVCRNLVWFVAVVSASAGLLADQPNILWITSEDNGPQLGCYGDKYATTPNIDALASRGLTYRYAWSNAPVCAPARTAIITGMYPHSLGAQHMRSMVRLPDGFKMFPQYLREAGYYCSNNSKQDYNVEKPGKVWDQSSGKAHWRNRRTGQPFFSVVNFTTTHESRIRARPHSPVHDPSKVRVPKYHPDAPEVRTDWAQYYDKLTEMDKQVGRVLSQLADDGLKDDTIVFYFGDHGPGMPRCKRWPYNSGLHVPMVVHVPPKFNSGAPDDYAVGAKTNRLVSFVDLAPTVLSLAGIKPPEHMQGQAFLGKFAVEQRSFVHGFRGRMDERYDMVRSVRNQRYIYIRNYMPHKIYGQHVSYMFQTPTTQVWKTMFDRGELNDAQARFWKTKPAEELYDLQEDPDEVNNLATSTKHVGIKKDLRDAQQKLALKIRDLGFLPEGEIHRRAGDRSPYEMGQDEASYPMTKILQAAESASLVSPDASKQKTDEILSHPDPGVRYWRLIGCNIKNEFTVETLLDLVDEIPLDPSPYVRIAGAEVLWRVNSATFENAVVELLRKDAMIPDQGPFPAMAALNVIDYRGIRWPGLDKFLGKMPAEYPGTHKRYLNYVPRLVEKIRNDLK